MSDLPVARPIDVPIFSRFKAKQRHLIFSPAHLAKMRREFWGSDAAAAEALQRCGNGKNWRGK